MGLVYLATPYTHQDKEIRDKRFEKVNEIAAKLMRDGLHIYSPISHTHPIALAGDLPTSWDFWEKYDREILSFCSKLIVFCQEGWKESRGVQAEIVIARELGIEVEYLEDL